MGKQKEEFEMTGKIMGQAFSKIFFDFKDIYKQQKEASRLRGLFFPASLVFAGILGAYIPSFLSFLGF